MNIIRTQPPIHSDFERIRCIRGRENILENYPDFLVDESRLTGESVDCIYHPESTDDVSFILRNLNSQNLRVTVSGGRTGIVGGAVALNSDCLISLVSLDKVLSHTSNSITVQSGITLDALNDFIATHNPDHFYPIDPTETTATAGGTVVCNASGARTYHYGPTRNWINALTVVLADGSILKLRRTEITAENRTFVFAFDNQPYIKFEFPDYEYPKTKNTTGIIFSDGMDAVDLFVGSEGILGIITEVEFKIIPKPHLRLYTVIWTESEFQSVEFVKEIRKAKNLDMLAIEYFDPHSIEILKQRHISDGEGSLIPRIDDSAKAAIFIDTVYEDDDDLFRITSEIENILKSTGLTLDNTWSGLEDSDLIKMKQLRHALPETINMIVAERKSIHPEIHKLSTDLAVPDGKLETMLKIYRDAMNASGIEYVIFGHIGDNHVHLNMLPQTLDELNRAKELYLYFAQQSVRLGGTVAAEHGIGRIKRHLMPLQYPTEMLDSMRRLKRILDPNGILNLGVLLPD